MYGGILIFFNMFDGLIVINFWCEVLYMVYIWLMKVGFVFEILFFLFIVLFLEKWFWGIDEIVFWYIWIEEVEEGIGKMRLLRVRYGIGNGEIIGLCFINKFK